jgi:hypothetical protein
MRAMAVAAHFDDRRIEPEDRIVDEDLAVDVADVERAHCPLRQELHRGRELDRDPEVAREVVEGAQGEHAEGDVAADQSGGDRTDRAVAAAGRNDLRSGGDGFLSRLLRLLAGDETDVRLQAGPLE